MVKSVQRNRRVNLPEVGLFSDGTAVKQVGAETFRLTKLHVDDFITVTTDEVCAAIKDVFQDTRNVLEPSGALSLAGTKKYIQRH
ncbi:pyridoxal-phosphate dependent enzyme, partial [Micrococcus luteus]|nr:pyridoxal-phosphate dependent enzyme [Micrococcus luteus]